MKMRCLQALSTMTGLLAAPSLVHATELQAGDEICIEGFVMDFFCIERGTLFDNPSVVSLLEPERHSVHCLVDVESCVQSPYEVLYALPADQATSQARHSRGWRFDDASKQMMLALARGVGRRAASPACTTCTEDMGGTLDFGFHAGMVATIVTPADAENPAVIAVTRAEHTTPGEPFCGANGSGNTNLEAAVPDFIILGAGNFETMARIHGSLMMIGWGVLLPSGVIIAKFFKHRPGGWWFKVHRITQPLGLVIVLAGFIVALVNFDALASGSGTSFIHGSLGVTVMTLGLFQPINAFVRPHPNQDGQPTNIKRTIWEYVHKGGGYIACFLAVVTISLGTTLLPSVSDQTAFQIAYGLIAGTVFCALAALAIREKRMFADGDAGQTAPLMGP